ncbi:hypothetical protein Scep_025683 [Stephania cephalantha]|uniref:Uncharacterized protein n=1 Tax=Stephania cephalantha TaxID=152367 RepID=A0AAP0HPK9_9MAGN
MAMIKAVRNCGRLRLSGGIEARAKCVMKNFSILDDMPKANDIEGKRGNVRVNENEWRALIYMWHPRRSELAFECEKSSNSESLQEWKGNCSEAEWLEKGDDCTYLNKNEVKCSIATFKFSKNLLTPLVYLKMRARISSHKSLSSKGNEPLIGVTLWWHRMYKGYVAATTSSLYHTRGHNAMVAPCAQIYSAMTVLCQLTVTYLAQVLTMWWRRVFCTNCVATTSSLSTLTKNPT